MTGKWHRHLNTEWQWQILHFRLYGNPLAFSCFSKVNHWKTQKEMTTLFLYSSLDFKREYFKSVSSSKHFRRGLPIFINCKIKRSFQQGEGLHWLYLFLSRLWSCTLVSMLSLTWRKKFEVRFEGWKWCSSLIKVYISCSARKQVSVNFTGLKSDWNEIILEINIKIDGF